MALFQLPDSQQGDDIAALREENHRLRKVCTALMERVESGGSPNGAPYAAFERSVLLAEQVRERTDALHRTLDELSQIQFSNAVANSPQLYQAELL